jgi:4-hydroxy-2-oxovalerate/4-hydroxy-2-oxohexanoate aldolase
MSQSNTSSLKGRKVILHDMCLRDGMHAKREQISVDQMVRSPPPSMRPACPIFRSPTAPAWGQLPAARLCAPQQRGIHLGRGREDDPGQGVGAADPGLGTMRELQSAYDCGARSVHVATHCTEADTAPQHIAYARKLGMDTTGFLMMAHLNDPEGIARQGKLMESYGAHTVYVTDRPATCCRTT